MKFRLNKLKVLRNILIAIAILLVGNILGIYLKFYGPGYEEKVSRLFIKLVDFNLEANLPTYFSSLLLLVNGIILALIGRRYKVLGQKHWPWYGLSLIFVFLALDEMLQIHEQFRAPMESLLDASGFLYYAWFVPYLIATLIIGVAYFKFMMALPTKILKLFLISAVIFITGAVCLEAISGMHAEDYGEANITYAIIYTFEELFEMLGSTVFLYALLTYLTLSFKNIKLSFKPKSIENTQDQTSYKEVLESQNA